MNPVKTPPSASDKAQKQGIDVISSNILSLQELKAVILEIREYAKWFGQGAIKKRFSKTELWHGPNVSQAAANIVLLSHSGKDLSLESLDNLVKELETYARSAPNIAITLAAPASASLKTDLVKWCRQNINAHILVDFKFNSTMLGGMVISYGSHIFDWSFRRQIMANRQKFAEILRHV